MPTIYQASDTGYFSTIILPILLAIALIGLAIYLSKKEVGYKNRNLKNLVFLMSLFGIMICMSVAIFSLLNQRHLQAVELSQMHLKIEGEEIPLKELKRVYLKQDFQSSHLSPQIIRDTTYLLVVEERAGKIYVLSDNNYPVKEMVVSINEAMK